MVGGIAVRKGVAVGYGLGNGVVWDSGVWWGCLRGIRCDYTE